MEFPNIPLAELGQFGIAYIALAVLIYAIVVLTKILTAAINGNKALEQTLKQFGRQLDTLSSAIENQTNMLNKLEQLMDEQSRFTQRMLEKLDVLWDIAVKKS